MAMENELQLWTSSQDRAQPRDRARSSPAGLKTDDRGLLRLKPDLPPEIAEAIENFERSSFRLTYTIIGFAGAVLVLMFLIAYCMILVAGK